VSVENQRFKNLHVSARVSRTVFDGGVHVQRRRSFAIDRKKASTHKPGYHLIAPVFQGALDQISEECASEAREQRADSVLLDDEGGTADDVRTAQSGDADRQREREMGA